MTAHMRHRESARRLVATTVDIDPAIPLDLLATAGQHGVLWWQGDHGLAGRGCAMTIDLPHGLADPDATARVADALATIEVRDQVGRPGTGPVALAALPFDRSTPAHLLVPAVLVGRSPDGRQWRTTIGAEGDAGEHLLTTAPEDVIAPEGFTLRTSRTHDDFKDLVAEAIEAIDRGDLGKVVLAREVVIDTNRPIAIASVLERLHALYPSCTVFSIEGFIGASPELLVERRGDRVHAHPLAGTFPRSGDPRADEMLAARLLQSVKDRSEHRFVIDELTRVLATHCVELDVPDGPTILPLRNVLHLGTDITGRLDPTRRAPTAFELAAELHPTPAVGGTPTAEALAWLDAHEQLDRARYAGPVGWVDANGDGSWYVGIRSAEVSERSARLFAGVGIVAGSEPDSELVETQLKLQALLAALVRP